MKNNKKAVAPQVEQMDSSNLKPSAKLTLVKKVSEKGLLIMYISYTSAHLMKNWVVVEKVHLEKQKQALNYKRKKTKWHYRLISTNNTTTDSKVCSPPHPLTSLTSITFLLSASSKHICVCGSVCVCVCVGGGGGGGGAVVCWRTLQYCIYNIYINFEVSQTHG